MASKAGYLITGVLALVVAILCAWFSLVAGAGWAYLVPSVIALLLIAGGLPLSPGNPALGAKLTGAGAAVGALVLLAMLVELIHAIPFREQPAQAEMLAVPTLLVVVCGAHSAFALSRSRYRL